jgi:ketosteroid isomerase-like protein
VSELGELIRRGYDAWNRRDWDTIFELLHPDIEWTPVEFGLLGETFRGHDRVREFFDILFEAWDEFRVDPETMIEGEETVLVIARVRTRGRGSGAEVDTRWAHVWTAAPDGRAIRMQAFDDPRKGYAAVGLPPP